MVQFMLCSLVFDGLAVRVGIVSSTFPVGLSSELFFVHVLFDGFRPEFVAVSMGIVSSALPVGLMVLCFCVVVVFVDRSVASWRFLAIWAGIVSSAVLLIVLHSASASIFVSVCGVVLNFVSPDCVWWLVVS